MASLDHRQLKFRKMLAKVSLPFLCSYKLPQARKHSSKEMPFSLCPVLLYPNVITCLLILMEHLMTVLLVWYAIIFSWLQNSTTPARPQWQTRQLVVLQVTGLWPLLLLPDNLPLQSLAGWHVEGFADVFLQRIQKSKTLSFSKWPLHKFAFLKSGL